MRLENTSISRTRQITGNALMILGGVMLIGSAGAKFAHVPKVVTELGAMGFDGNKLIFIAILEILSALLFLIPVARSFGLLMVSAYMGGAIATHLGHDQPAIQPAFVLAIFWFGAWLRHREILWSLRHPTLATSPLPQQENREMGLGRD